jgi:xanthine/uracil permease
MLALRQTRHDAEYHSGRDTRRKRRAPVAITLVAENLNHIKAIGAMTGRSLDRFLGRAFLGDSLATIVSAFGGGTGVTTYAENIGVMAATKVYSTLLFVVAAIVSILLGFSPKFGALILSIPGPVIGGLSIVLFGLIAAIAGRIWVENKVDFSDPRNLITVAAALTAGAGDHTQVRRLHDERNWHRKVRRHHSLSNSRVEQR